jgi:hypothetical protein
MTTNTTVAVTHLVMSTFNSTPLIDPRYATTTSSTNISIPIFVGHDGQYLNSPHEVEMEILRKFNKRRERALYLKEIDDYVNDGKKVETPLEMMDKLIDELNKDNYGHPYTPPNF